MNDRKTYDLKHIRGRDFYDYWNLKEHPLYFLIDKKVPSYITIDEIVRPRFRKINSLHEIARYLDEFECVSTPKYWRIIGPAIQSYINIPYSPLGGNIMSYFT